MITEKVLKILRECISIYDEKRGRDYLIIFAGGKSHIPDFCQITFYHYNYWHLLGCKLESNDSLRIYRLCKEGKDISNEVSIVHMVSDVFVKGEVFKQVFDFVRKAKMMKAGYTNKGPEQYEFKMALGNGAGIILYGREKNFNKAFLIPKSTQKKPMAKVSNDNNKILYILSKRSEDKLYNQLDYEIKKGLFCTDARKYLTKDVLLKIDLQLYDYE